ncbi:hypothetical protein [Kutzneria sp. CA-103260]|uniref:hypothetical protein n=1 Tax=Kutzneria sp. CA-103260 TaxID=2802641 RepID=UPI001BAA3161|nr:hypothetical protein [Kutzneria sp. CA-103260]QUQ63629.1 hypothetical protein JJ691_13420 [Kutzneria sp. CA-103260]
MATARQRWTQLERRLWTAFRRGDLVDVRPEGTDPTHIWGPTRTVRAEVLRELLLACPPSLLGHVGGLQLAGARITGSLDLSHGRIDQPFAFLECWFDEPIDLSATRTQAVFIQDCRVPGINADGLRTDGELNLDGLLCTGRLDLDNAHVSGRLELSGARLFNPNGIALSAAAADFGRDVLLHRGFSAVGEVSLPGARIEGDFNLSTATISNLSDDAIYADSAKIGGNVLAGVEFRAIGRICFASATIGRDFILSDAILDCPEATAVAFDKMHVEGDLVANRSVVVGGFSMMSARVDGQLGLNGTVLSNPGGDAFSGDSLHVGTGVFGRGGLRVTGAFRLPGARVGGTLTLKAATLSNPDEVALMASAIVVDGDVFLDFGFSVVGETRLSGAHIRGQLSLVNAVLSYSDAIAFNADSMSVDSGFFVRQCHVDGEMHMIGAHIRGDLDLEGAVLVSEGNTLNAEGLDVSGNVFCWFGFHSTGTMQLGGARIGGQLTLRDATLHNPDGYVLRANHLTVGEDILADENFTVRGMLDLFSCRVTGVIRLAVENVDTVGLPQTRADRLRLTGTPHGRMRLTDVTVRVLEHHPDDWPEPGKLSLHGLTYSALHPLDVPATRWLDWLRRGLPDGYRPQPYAQLASTLRNVGNDRDARVVLLARQRHRRRHLPLWSKPWGWLQDVAVGYGYVPWRAAGWLGILWLAGWLYFRDQRPLPGSSGDYQPALYALDLLLPVLSIGQRGTVHFTGAAQIVAAVMTVCSWILGIAVLAGLTRALTRN